MRQAIMQRSSYAGDFTGNKRGPEASWTIVPTTSYSLPQSAKLLDANGGRSGEWFHTFRSVECEVIEDLVLVGLSAID